MNLLNTIRMGLPPLPDFIAQQLPADTQRHTLSIEGYTIHYLIRGTGRPVFMMHGNPTWSFLYRKIMAELDPDEFQCIAPDLVGLGFSDKPTDPSFHTLENHQRIMASFTQQVLPGPFIFVGQDWGGPIGLLASIQANHPMQGMVLLNTIIRPPRPGFKSTSFHKFSRMPGISDWVFRRFHFPQRYLHTAQGDKSSIRGQVAKAYAYPIRSYKENLAPLMLARMVPDSLEHPSVDFLKQTDAFAAGYKGPVELVWGKNDPVLGRLSNAHQKLMPHANLTLTEGGHFIQEEHPELIAQAIKAVANQV